MKKITSVNLDFTTDQVDPVIIDLKHIKGGIEIKFVKSLKDAVHCNNILVIEKGLRHKLTLNAEFEDEL